VKVRKMLMMIEWKEVNEEHIEIQPAARLANLPL